MKTCHRCRIPKDDREFGYRKLRSGNLGLRAWCKPCYREYDRIHWASTDRKHKTRERNKANRANIQSYIDDWLRSHPCVDCGESDIVVLEFDHVRGVKVREVSTMTRSAGSLPSVQAEIDKCDVRCANCHRRVTHKRRMELKSQAMPF